MREDPQIMLQRFGERLTEWRIILNLPQALAAERANISVTTLRRIEHGDPGVKLGTIMELARVYGIEERLMEAVDPLLTDLGRARAHMLSRQRATRSDSKRSL